MSSVGNAAHVNIYTNAHVSSRPIVYDAEKGREDTGSKEKPFWDLHLAASTAPLRPSARLISQAPLRLPYIPKSVRQLENRSAIGGEKGSPHGTDCVKSSLC